MIHMTMNRSFFAYRVWCFVVTIIPVLTVACSVLPFYALGINQQPVNLVAGGQFDPKGFAFYQSTSGELMYIVGIIMVVAAPIALIGYTPLLLWSARRDWKRLATSWKLAGLLLVIINVALLLFLYTGTGRLILTWFLD